MFVQSPVSRIVSFDEKRALAVFRILEPLWLKKEGIFREIILPQDIWRPPTENDKELANWLFYAALPMRGGVISEDPFRWLYHLRIHHPKLFVPREARFTTIEEIKEAFRDATIHVLGKDHPSVGTAGVMEYKMGEHPEAWKHNSTVLDVYLAGQALNIFAGAKNFEQAFARVNYTSVGRLRGLLGMRRKIFSLFTIWLQEKELVPKFASPIPVDFHALRVLTATGVVRLDWKTISQRQNGAKELPDSYLGKPGVRIGENITDAIALWSQPFFKQHRLLHMAINPALWVLSRILCADQIQNTTPADKETGQDKAILRTPEYLESHPRTWPKKYKDPCAHCPLEKFCTMALPSGPYYRAGLLIPIPRVPYEYDQFPFMQELLYPARNNKRPLAQI